MVSSFKIKRSLYFLPTKIALDINKKNPKHVKPFMNFLSSLLEENFACRSAEYDAGSKTCVLSRDDRRTQPEAFRYSLLRTSILAYFVPFDVKSLAYFS